MNLAFATRKPQTLSLFGCLDPNPVRKICHS